MKMDIMDKIVNPRVQYLIMDMTCCMNVMLHTVINGCKQSSGCNNSYLSYTRGFRMAEPLCKTIREEKEESKASFRENHIKQYRKYLQPSR